MVNIPPKHVTPNILFIVISLQPKRENDISTPATAGKKPPGLQQVFGLRYTAQWHNPKVEYGFL